MRCGEIWAENATPTPNTKGKNHWRQGKKGKNGKCDKCGEKLTTKIAVDVHDRKCNQLWQDTKRHHQQL